MMAPALYNEDRVITVAIATFVFTTSRQIFSLSLEESLPVWLHKYAVRKGFSDCERLESLFFCSQGFVC